MAIKILDDKTINKIAAGEVIENPSNIVKELVENAIDSGAKNITVDIKNGGNTYIRVSDDGCGFEKEDIKIAFLKHATSKLTKLEDIYNILSYGFRGEALSSIAAVSKTTLITKNRNYDNISGYKYVIDKGVGNELEEVASNIGTSIIVENLFENVPVRKKFLKSESKENAYVFDIIMKISLARPDISFKLYIDSKLKYKTSGDDNLKNVIYDIYGKEIFDNLLEIDESIKDVKLYGYIAKPIIARNNKNDEIYFVNDRFVKNNIISKAIEEAYSEYLMQHKFPFVVLMIECNKSDVDVNVHPKKAEVRFGNDDIIFYAIYNVIYNTLKNINLIHTEVLNSNYDININKEKQKIDIEKQKIDIEKIDIENERKNIQETTEYKKYNNTIATTNIQGEHSSIIAESEKKIKKTINIDELPKLSDIVYNNTNSGIKLNNLFKKIEEKPFITKTLTENHKYIGQVFDTYILVEYEEKLYIIDQHAAHEKINFENLMKNYKEKKILSQKIFPSVILKLTPLQYVAVEKNIEEFRKIGFEIETFGDKDIKVDAVPYNLLSINKKEVLLDMIDSFVDDRNKEQYDSIVEKIASMSCKKAIKANHILTEIEVKNLLRELFKLDNPYNCPHGRPTIISLSKNEFERKFGRIV